MTAVQDSSDPHQTINMASLPSDNGTNPLHKNQHKVEYNWTLKNIFNWRRKECWIVSLVGAVITFTVLGVFVWGPMYSKKSNGGLPIPGNTDSDCTARCTDALEPCLAVCALEPELIACKAACPKDNLACPVNCDMNNKCKDKCGVTAQLCIPKCNS